MLFIKYWIIYSLVHLLLLVWQILSLGQSTLDKHSTLKQPTFLSNASPKYPIGQVHAGTWSIMLHNALFPQALLHNSVHLSFTQAKFEAQSSCFLHEFGLLQPGSV